MGSRAFFGPTASLGARAVNTTRYGSEAAGRNARKDLGAATGLGKARVKPLPYGPQRKR